MKLSLLIRKTRQMKYAISLIVVVLAVQSIQAQQGRTKMHELLIEEFKMEVNDYKRLEDRYENVEGSPFFTEDFQKGKIFISGNKSFTDVELNYNMHSDNFEFIADGGKVFVLSNLEEIEKIVYDNKTFRHMEYSYGVGKPTKGYLLELVNGDCSLYKRVESEFREEEVPKTGYDQYRPPRFVDKSPAYFIKCSDDETAVVISSMRRKKFLKSHFKERRKELLKWMRSNSINLRNEEDMVKFFNHVNKSMN